MTTGSVDGMSEQIGEGPEKAVGCALGTGDRDSRDGACVDAGDGHEHSASCTKKVAIFNQFIDKALAGLPPTASALWLTLFRFEKQGVAWVSQDALAKRMGVNEKTVYRNMKILLAKELVRIEHHGGLGQGSHKYRLGLLPLEPRTNLNRFKNKSSARERKPK
jgi:hypothetical protein